MSNADTRYLVLSGERLVRYVKHNIWCAMRQGVTKHSICICGASGAVDEWRRESRSALNRWEQSGSEGTESHG